MIILILSSKICIFISKYLFKIFASYHFRPCLPQDPQLHAGYDQLLSLSLLLRCDPVSSGNLLSTFGINFHTHLQGAKYF